MLDSGLKKGLKFNLNNPASYIMVYNLEFIYFWISLF